MRLVIDTNAAIEIVLGRPNMPAFRELLNQAEEVIAPELLQIESGNVLWKLHRHGIIPNNDIFPILQDIEAIVDKWYFFQQLKPFAMPLAVEYQISVYDSCYLSLAKIENAALLTLDKKLQEATIKIGVELAHSS
ncbi:MAG: type II toxin-antitoxin system VapC family toxin [Saprospiraceae bacterium]|jgi:predicted nucleic acid-binding protein|nr:type II toxin-antitoxin system VapC family toxin [Saprospiraceae bacterium]